MLALGWISCNSKPELDKNFQIESTTDSISYALGVNMAASLRKQGFDEIDPEVFAAGVAHMLHGLNDSVMSEKEALALISSYYFERRGNLLERIAAESTAFLDSIAQREGIEELESGVLYEVLQEGKGKVPQATDNVKCHYKAMLPDGTVYQNTMDLGTPVIFPANGTLKGIEECLLLMPTGSKWRIYMPAEMAYGRRPPTDTPVKPNQAVVYELELLKVQRPTQINP